MCGGDQPANKGRPRATIQWAFLLQTYEASDDSHITYVATQAGSGGGGGGGGINWSVRTRRVTASARVLRVWRG